MRKFGMTAVLNATPLLASGNNVKALGGMMYISDGVDISGLSTSSDPFESLIPPIPIADIISIEKKYPVAEVAQVKLFGYGTEETITASTKYTVMCNIPDYMGTRREPAQFSYTSAAVLSGTAGVDRHNVMAALAGKINAYEGVPATAYPIVSFAYTTGTDAPTTDAVPVVGSIITGDTSGATAKIVGYTTASGGWAAGSAAGVFKVVILSGTFEAEDLTIKTGGAAAGTGKIANATITYGLGLAIYDDGGYNIKFEDYPNQQPTGWNRGAGWKTSVFSTLTAGVVSIGDGTRMLTDLVPTYNRDKSDAISGDALFKVNDLPVSGRQYAIVDIQVNKKHVRLMDNGNESRVNVYTILVDNGTTTGAYDTDSGNFIAGLATASGLTVVAND